MPIDFERLHTTLLGAGRIGAGLGLPFAEIGKVTEYCKNFAKSAEEFYQRGKNFYFIKDGKFITVNCSAMSIITAGELRNIPINKGTKK